MARTAKKETDSTSKSTKATKSAAKTKAPTTKTSGNKSTDKRPSEAQAKSNKRSAAPRKATERPAEPKRTAKQSAESEQPAKQPVATETDTAPRARRTPSRTNRVTVEPATHNPFVKTASADEIAERAYFLYLERGGHHGCDVDDWLEAERQVTGTHG